MPKDNITRVMWFFLVIFLLAGIGFLFVISPFFEIIAMAVVMSILFYPVYKFLHVQRKLPQIFASIVTCLCIVLVVFIPTMVLISLLTREVYTLYVLGQEWINTDQVQSFLQGPSLLDRLNIFLSRWHLSITIADLNKIISMFVQKLGPFLYQQTQAVVIGIASFIISFCVMLLVVFYFLIDGTRFKSFAHKLSLLPNNQDAQVMDSFVQMVRGIFLGSGSAAVIDGILGGVAFWLCGFSSPVMWGVIMGIFAFLPVLGVGTVMVPVIIYMAITKQWIIVAGLTCVYLIVIILVDNFLMPRIIGKYSRIHPLVIFLSVLGGISLFGILGVVFGPLIAAVFLALAEIYQKNYKNHIVCTE